MLWDNFGVLAEQLYCIDNLNATIYGYFDDDNIQYLSIQTAICNEANDPDCPGTEAIKDLFTEQTFYFNIFFVDTTINLQDYHNPSHRQLFTKSQGMSSYAYKYMEIAMKNQRYETNDILIFDNNISESSIAYDTHDFGETNIGTDNFLFDCMFISSNVFTIHYRIYQKISDVLANVGGISSVAIFCCEIGCYFFARTRRNEQILNGIFEYDITDQSKDGIKSKLWFNEKFWARQSYNQKNLNCGFVNSENSDELSSKNSDNVNNKNISLIDNNNVFRDKRTDYRSNTKIFSKEMTNVNGLGVNIVSYPVNDNFNLISIKTKNSKTHFKPSKYPTPQEKDVVDNINGYKNTFQVGKIEPKLYLDKNISSDHNVNVNSHENNGDLISVSSSERALKGQLSEKLQKKQLSSSSVVNFDKNGTPIPDEKTKLTSKNTKITPDMVNKIIKMRDKPTQQIHFTFCDVLFLYTCRCCARTKARKMFRLLQKSEPILDELLDIRVFVRKLDELDKLKMVLLSEKQLALFNFISKEMCSLDPEKLKQSEMYNFKKKIRDIHELGKQVIEYIEDIGQKGEAPKNAIDEKLINLLHDEVKANLAEDNRKKI